VAALEIPSVVMDVLRARRSKLSETLQKSLRLSASKRRELLKL